MDQIRANTPAPIKANLMTEQLSVQMSWGNGGCTRAGSPGDQQLRTRVRAMGRSALSGHDAGERVGPWWVKEKCWVMPFTDPCDVSDDVIPGHVKIGTCDMLSVFPWIRFILNRSFTLETIKRTPNDRFAIWLLKHSTWCSAGTQFNTHIKRQFSHVWQPVPNDVNSD